MGHALHGWIEFVVEVQWMVDESADFEVLVAGVTDANPLAKHLDIEASSTAEAPLAAMMEDQLANTSFVRYAGPAAVVGPTMSYLDQVCQRAFPRGR